MTAGNGPAPTSVDSGNHTPAWRRHGIAPEDALQLRFALAMNGGVSLAVWIGGVSLEIERTVNREGIYGRLLDLTATSARVDVIVGTSAGGINGALLAHALVQRTSMKNVRDVWLDNGALEQLLRTPAEDNPPSILRGNEYFLPALTQAFEALTLSSPGAGASADDVPMDLILTTTLLRGHERELSDELGEVIRDTKHRGHLQFSRGPGRDGIDPFMERHIAARLAVAARATASFPVAFEPVPLRVFADETKRDETDPHDMTGIASFTGDHLVIDGGVLDNKPLEATIDAIFRQRQSHEVRRILAYIVPSSGAAEATAPDDAQPTIAETAVASLITLPRSESISAQLDAIVAHNRNVLRRRQRRETLTKNLAGAKPEALAASLYPAYRARRIESAVEFIMLELLDAVADQQDADATLTRLERDLLFEKFVEFSAPPKTGAPAGVRTAPWIPNASGFADAAAQAAGAAEWNWGRFTVENLLNMVSDILRVGIKVAPLRAEAGISNDATWVARRSVEAARAKASELLLSLPRRPRVWTQRAPALVAILHDETTRASGDALLRAWWEDAVAAWNTGPNAGFLQRQAQHAKKIVAALAEVLDALGTLHAAAAASSQRIDPAALERLGVYLAYLRSDATNDTKEPVQDLLLRRLLALEVVEYVAGVYTNEAPETYVELVQFSAAGKSPLGGPDEADGKLAGMQLANFGGFYLQAWRANDWMWGRMDAARRLVRVILDPARLARVYGATRPLPAGAALPSHDVAEALRALALHDADPRDLSAQQAAYEKARPQLLAELQFLDAADLRIPDSLTHCVDFVLTSLHLQIAREELPVVNASIAEDAIGGQLDTGASAKFARLYASLTGGPVDTKARGALTTTASRMRARAGNMLANMFPDRPHRPTVRAPRADGDHGGALSTDAVRQLVSRSGIGAERIMATASTDRFVRLSAQLLAVSSAALSGSAGGLGIISGLLRAIRVPTLLIDGAVGLLLARTRSTAVLVSALVAVSAVSLTTASCFHATLPSTFQALCWGFLIVCALYVSVSRRRWWVALLILALGIAAPWLRPLAPVCNGVPSTAPASTRDAT